MVYSILCMGVALDFRDSVLLLFVLRIACPFCERDIVFCLGACAFVLEIQ